MTIHEDIRIKRRKDVLLEAATKLQQSVVTENYDALQNATKQFLRALTPHEISRGIGQDSSIEIIEHLLKGAHSNGSDREHTVLGVLDSLLMSVDMLMDELPEPQATVAVLSGLGYLEDIDHARRALEGVHDDNDHSGPRTSCSSVECVALKHLPG